MTALLVIAGFAVPHVLTALAICFCNIVFYLRTGDSDAWFD